MVSSDTFFSSEGHSLLNETRNWFSGISILHAWLRSRRRRNISGIFDHRTQIFGSASQTRGKSDQNVEFAKVLWLWNPLLILHERFRDFVLAGNQNMQFLALWYWFLASDGSLQNSKKLSGLCEYNFYLFFNFTENVKFLLTPKPTATKLVFQLELWNLKV